MVGHTIYHSRKGPTLTSDHGRNQSYHHVRTALYLHLTIGGIAYHHVRRDLHLHLTMGGPAYHHVKRAYGLITSPWKEPQSGEH